MQILIAFLALWAFAPAVHAEVGKWKKVTCTVPALQGHSAVEISKDDIFVFGGQRGTQFFNNHYILKRDGSSTQYPHTEAEIQASADHAAARVGDNEVLIAGGRNGTHALSSVYHIDFSSGVKVTRRKDLPRHAIHSLGMAASDDGELVVIFGGDSFTNTHYNDILVARRDEAYEFKEVRAHYRHYIPALAGNRISFLGKSNDSIYHFVISGGYEYAYGQEPVLYRLEIDVNDKQHEHTTYHQISSRPQNMVMRMDHYAQVFDAHLYLWGGTMESVQIEKHDLLDNSWYFLEPAFDDEPDPLTNFAQVQSFTNSVNREIRILGGHGYGNTTELTDMWFYTLDPCYAHYDCASCVKTPGSENGDNDNKGGEKNDLCSWCPSKHACITSDSAHYPQYEGCNFLYTDGVQCGGTCGSWAYGISTENDDPKCAAITPHINWTEPVPGAVHQVSDFVIIRWEFAEEIFGDLDFYAVYYENYDDAPDKGVEYLESENVYSPQSDYEYIFLTTEHSEGKQHFSARLKLRSRGGAISEEDKVETFESPKFNISRPKITFLQPKAGDVINGTKGETPYLIKWNLDGWSNLFELELYSEAWPNRTVEYITFDENITEFLWEPELEVQSRNDYHIRMIQFWSDQVLADTGKFTLVAKQGNIIIEGEFLEQENITVKAGENATIEWKGQAATGDVAIFLEHAVVDPPHYMPDGILLKGGGASGKLTFYPYVQITRNNYSMLIQDEISFSSVRTRDFTIEAPKFIIHVKEAGTSKANAKNEDPKSLVMGQKYDIYWEYKGAPSRKTFFLSNNLEETPFDLISLGSAEPEDSELTFTTTKEMMEFGNILRIYGRSDWNERLTNTSYTFSIGQIGANSKTYLGEMFTLLILAIIVGVALSLFYILYIRKHLVSGIHAVI
ncbi:MAG: hypothetical protein EZS28_001870 [Streblomastix strix]|uniref:Fibronectin type-III domain-containing protein n=1 Tax=Streblomastix strix TaxID=222440 RepID=A0A5J4X5U8_9EUKA|nr:MAG: hypothetical protein EZS28_001870 [Streblomastix strix]